MSTPTSIAQAMDFMADRTLQEDGLLFVGMFGPNSFTSVPADLLANQGIKANRAKLLRFTMACRHRYGRSRIDLRLGHLPAGNSQATVNNAVGLLMDPIVKTKTLSKFWARSSQRHG